MFNRIKKHVLYMYMMKGNKKKIILSSGRLDNWIRIGLKAPAWMTRTRASCVICLLEFTMQTGNGNENPLLINLLF